nr:F-box-associated protein [Nicotiana plumbaginifolia]
MRFKCVTKFCNSLASESDFLSIHVCRSMTRPGGTEFFSHETRPVFYTTGQIDELYYLAPAYSGLDYVNGLFCFWGPTFAGPAAIFNPSTGEVRFLPNLNNDFVQCNYSLGFESEEKKYKVLLTTKHVREGYNKYWNLTLGVDKLWREIKNIYPRVLCMPGVCISGVIYRFVYYKGQLAIDAFDVKSEKFKIVGSWKNSHDYKLMEVKGKLAVMDYEKHTCGHIFLWILEHNPKKQWKNHIIQFSCNDIQFSTILSCTSRDGQIVFIMNSRLENSYTPMCYDVMEKRWRALSIKELPKESYIQRFLNYIESLFPLRKF